jgi:hypothetical protein
MPERRISPRQASLVFYDLHFAETGQRFGDLVDLSGQGLMAASEVALVPGARVALRMDIGSRQLATRSVTFDAECRWCREVPDAGGYACGMQLVSGAPAEAPQIPDLAATMLFDAMRSF